MERAINHHNANIIVLSIDVVLGPISADLQSPTAVAGWKALILQGRVAALVAGPPCETWSRARALQTLSCGTWRDPGAQCSCGHRVPRPERTATHLWGRPSINTKEQRAVKLGNNLYRTTI